jgi:hypothetical protein
MTISGSYCFHMEQHVDRCKTNEKQITLIRGYHILAKPIIDIWQSSVHGECAVPTTGVLPHVQHTVYNIYTYAC